jgi:hypothetical protein
MSREAAARPGEAISGDALARLIAVEFACTVF